MSTVQVLVAEPGRYCPFNLPVTTNLCEPCASPVKDRGEVHPLTATPSSVQVYVAPAAGEVQEKVTDVLPVVLPDRSELSVIGSRGFGAADAGAARPIPDSTIAAVATRAGSRVR